MAAKYLEKAVRIKEHPVYWSELAASYSNLPEESNGRNNGKLTLNACRHVMDRASSPENSPSILDQTEKAVLSLMPELLSLSGDENQERLQSKLSEWDWDFANALLRLAGLPSTYVLISANDDARIKNFFIKRFHADWAKDASVNRDGDKIYLKDDNHNISLTFDMDRSNAIIDLDGKETHFLSARKENDLLILLENPGNGIRVKRLNELISTNVNSNILKSQLFPYALSTYVNEQLSRQKKDDLIKLTNELSIWDWGYNSISKKINECDLDLSKDIRMEPIYELKLASNLLSNLNEIDEIKDNNDKRIRLEQLKERQLDGSWMWGYAKVLLSLSNIEDDREMKKWQLNEAFSILQRYCPPEIAINKAQGQFVLALADNGDISDALFQAQRSVALSPEESRDRSMLSYVYQHFNSFEESNSQLEICMSIDPGYDYSYESMAWSKLEAINQLRDQKAREMELKKYIEIMQNYIEIQQSETLLDRNSANNNINSRAKAYFWLGTAYHRLNDYDMAISNLEKARKLLTSNNGSFLLAMLSLGIVYLDIKAYSKCESAFKELIAASDYSLEAPSLDIDYWLLSVSDPCIPMSTDSVDLFGDADFEKQTTLQSMREPSDELCAGYAESSSNALKRINEYERELIDADLIYPPVSVDYILARACLSLSISYIQRDANLPEANYLIDRASRSIANLDDKEQKNRERKIKLDAMHDDCRGCLIYRQLRLGYYENNRIKECIESLEDAVNKEARPEYYLHLAQALEFRLEANDRPSEKADFKETNSRIILKRALACCDHVAELDLQKKYTEEAKELQKRLEKLGKKYSN
jgi:hypothetical protein